ncbi:MAG: hypothetical protein HC897_04955 [Thermoanaerobaculia bacterium]|nr:hypothetical protein [Thermoanaerobaculia bacterium]
MPLFIYPGIPTEVVEKQLSVEGLRAVVVQSFGSGNIPTRPDLVEAFRKARAERNIILATVSQCRRGPVELGIYETSAELLEAGFVAASDLTVEAAQCKLMTLLGDPDIEIGEVEAAYQASVAGEQTVSQFITKLSDQAGQVEGSDSASEKARFRLPAKPLAGVWNPQRIDRALLRLRRGQVSFSESSAVELRVYINVDPEETLTEDHPNLVGRFRKWPMEQAGLVVFDATRAIRAVAKPGERISFTFLVATPGATLSWGATDLALFIREVGS